MGNSAPEEVAQRIAYARRDGGELLGSLLEQYRNYLYLIARTQIDLHLSVRASPSDVVQETFLQASREFEQFQGENAQQLLAWLRKILLNNILTAYDHHVRTQKRDLRRDRPLLAVARSIDQSSLQIEQALVKSGDAPEQSVIREERAAQVADLLADLPGHYREVIILRNLESMSFEEIAQRMGRSNAAVRKLWTRAIERLRLPSNTQGDRSPEGGIDE